MKHLLSAVIFVFASATSFAQTSEILLDSISFYMGQHVKICAKVDDTFRAEKENALTYLNFGGKYPEHKFTVVIFATDLPNFPYIPVQNFKDKNVCVEGMLSEFRGKAQIVAKFPNQITII
ncbi:MAG: hypothetical protein IPM42_01870 [Saprospiraceae bacterium]|nr:hypothetical protein [Saprospiraceae bacterium]